MIRRIQVGTVNGLNTVVWVSCAVPILFLYLMQIMQLIDFVHLGDCFHAIIEFISASSSIPRDAAILCLFTVYLGVVAAAITCLFFMLIESLQRLLHRQVKAAILIIVIPALIWTFTILVLATTR